MPLKPGKSKATIRQNVREMIEAGHPPAQAAAAEYRKAGKYTPTKGKKGK